MSENRRRTWQSASTSASVSRKQRLEKLQLVSRALIASGDSLTIDDVLSVCRGTTKVFLSPSARTRIHKSRQVAENAAARGVPIYGMNTQLGPYAGRSLSPAEIEEFQIDTVAGHSVLHGEPLETATVRAMMLTRINGFAKGTSGIKIETVEALLEMLNKRVHPLVIAGCSVGQSDLSEMAQIAAVLIGQGEAEFRGRRLSGSDALKAADLQPIKLAGKEALSLISANGLTLGHGAIVFAETEQALRAFELAAALSLEGFAANLSPIHPAASRVKAQPGYVAASANLRTLLMGSYLWQDGSARNLQDPLSFRCIPIVHGALHDSICRLRETLEIELNSGSDNPLVAIEEDSVFSAGNFDITHIAIGFDTLRLALTHAINIANERIQKHLWQEFTGLPVGLERQDDRSSRLIPLARAAAAFTAEAQSLANPVSLSFRSQIGQGVEDTGSMAPLAVEQTRKLVRLAMKIVAIELLIAATAVGLRGAQPLGAGTRRIYEFISSFCPVRAPNWHTHLDRLIAELNGYMPRGAPRLTRP